MKPTVTTIGAVLKVQLRVSSLTTGRTIGSRHEGFVEVTDASPDNKWIEVRPLYQGDASTDNAESQALGARLMDMSPLHVGDERSYNGPARRITVHNTSAGKTPDYLYEDLDPTSVGKKRAMVFSVWNGDPVPTMRRSES